MSPRGRKSNSPGSLVFGPVRKGEALTPAVGDAEALPAGWPPESPVSTERLMEEICFQ